ncbi:MULTISPECIES: MipA/OmpV family protein [unclassified Aureimonas]|uniref:MipA/OmpV family protein n=1 Tax=unclassified Aureimonas TaxID=2615206 RepID=UPI0006F4B0FC|nr:MULTISPECIES: MipA/OmpV family protein [unclassified Aureimonas]KQT64409.1 structural protein MipA [Aureimonas sp. Leaf427]KQT81599.1 structural protein MipA [Aureimonas sp. Leaf460]
MVRFALSTLLLGSTLSAAAAADVYEPEATVLAAPSDSVSMVIELGIGGLVAPKYEGSDNYEVSPYPIISLDYLSIPGLFTVGSPTPNTAGGFSIGPSFGYTGEREEPTELRGLFDVDATYEAGVKVGYEWTYAEIYGEARYAFGGAEGLVGSVGANLIARPTPELELKAGPLATFASEDYMDTYFGVTSFEAARSGGRFSAYDADGGFKTVGAAATARYEFRPEWFLNAKGSYETFVGDAEDSPIVKAGSEDQFTFGVGISKRFSINF